MKIPEIVIMVGNIGSGKSTYIKNTFSKSRTHVVISRDALRYMIGAGNYWFDVGLEGAIWKSEKNILINFMKLKKNIVVDEVCMCKSMRKRYIDLAKKFGYKVIVYHLPIYSKRKCVNRRLKNPHGQLSRKLWNSVWDKFNLIYQAPSKKEGIDKIIKLRPENESIYTRSECKSSWYGTRYLVCPKCKQRGGYHIYFDSDAKYPFKCKCGYGIKKIRELYEKT